MNNRVIVLTTMVFILAASFVTAQNVLDQVEQKLELIAVYDYGDSRVALTGLSGLLREAAGDKEKMATIETKMDDFLLSDATFAGKQFICKKLSVYGTEKSIPALKQLLADAKTADIALYALERIPAQEVNVVLRDMLPRVGRHTKIGIINCLGQRQDPNAVNLLTPLASDEDAGISESAVAALGKIGTGPAVKVLNDLLVGDEADRLVVMDAWLACADRRLEGGQKNRAIEMYEKIYESKTPSPARAAALRGMLHAAEEKESIILSVLQTGDGEMQTIAIGVLKELPESQKMDSIAEELFKLAPEEQIQLLTAIGDRRENAVRDIVVQAVESENVDVRIAALQTLRDVGDAKDAVLLAQKAAITNGDEKETARESLALLRGEKTDAVILAEIPKADAKVKAELVGSVGARQSPNAVSVLMTAATDANRNVQRAAFKSLAVVAGPDDLNDILALLQQVESNNVRNEAERTAVAVANKIEDGPPSKPILDVYAEARDMTDKESRLYVLGRLGDSSALPVLRQALSSENADVKKAAIRALADWPGTEPMEDLLKIAGNDQDDVMQILALRGYINLLRVPAERSDAETVRLYQNAMQLAGQVNEKRLVLSGLAHNGSPEALEAAAGYLGEKEIKAEAEVAVLSIAGGVRWNNPGLAGEMVEKVIEGCEDPERLEDAGDLLGQIRK